MWWINAVFRSNSTRFSRSFSIYDSVCYFGTWVFAPVAYIWHPVAGIDFSSDLIYSYMKLLIPLSWPIFYTPSYLSIIYNIALLLPNTISWQNKSVHQYEAISTIVMLHLHVHDLRKTVKKYMYRQMNIADNKIIWNDNS